MKKFFVTALLSAGLVLTSTTSMASDLHSVETEPVTGGWMTTEKTSISQDIQQLFDKAAKDLVGVTYKPVAYLGYQVVAGKNHCILCKARVVYPNAPSYYALVYIYEDLERNATITNITKLDIAELSHPNN